MIDVMGRWVVSTAYDGRHIVRFLMLHSGPAHLGVLLSCI
jgi:hypothetical protein